MNLIEEIFQGLGACIAFELEFIYRSKHQTVSVTSFLLLSPKSVILDFLSWFK
jgi:hypothetical protein